MGVDARDRMPDEPDDPDDPRDAVTPVVDQDGPSLQTRADANAHWEPIGADAGDRMPNEPGDPDDPSDAFTLIVDEDGLSLQTRAEAGLYYETCSGRIVVEKEGEDGSFVPLQDDRPPSWNSPGCYQDGTFFGPSYNEGCDVLNCTDLNATMWLVPTAAYVKTGERTPPDDAQYPGPEGRPDVVVEVETRPLVGRLRVTITYATEDTCDESLQSTVEVDVPERL